MSNVNLVDKSIALATGSDLWIIENQSNKTWWNRIDLKSGFLLSSTLLFRKTAPSLKIKEITDQIEMPMNSYQSMNSSTLLGTADHFPNKWLLLVPEYNVPALEEVTKISKKLNAKGIRFFGVSKDIVHQINSRLSASLENITFIE